MFLLSILLFAGLALLSACADFKYSVDFYVDDEIYKTVGTNGGAGENFSVTCQVRGTVCYLAVKLTDKNQTGRFEIIVVKNWRRQK